MANIRKPFGTSIAGNLINVGAVTAPASGTIEASESGDGVNQRTVLTFTGATAGSPTGAAALGFGKLVYTFPAGAIIVKSTKFNLALQGGGVVDADTPDVGLGTVIASGVVSVLSGTATFENVHTGQTFNDCNGTAEVVTNLATASPFALVIETAAAHTLHLNIADTWAGADDLLATGTVTIDWAFIG